MNRNSVLLFIFAIAVTALLTDRAIAQSATPNADPPFSVPPPSGVAAFDAQMIERFINSQSEESASLRKELKNIRENREQLATQLSEFDAAENESGVSIESFPEIVKNLQSKRIELIIDLAGLEAKREAILAANNTKQDNSEIVAPLEKLVALQQNKLERIREIKAPSAEIRAAEASLLSSKVQLATAKNQNRSSKLLTDALLSTSLAQAESKARLAKTESLLSEILPARKKLESSKQLKLQASRYVDDEKDLVKQIREMERNIERLSIQLRAIRNDK